MTCVPVYFGWAGAFSIGGASFRFRPVPLRLLPPVSVAADHFFQVIRQDPERVKQGV